MISVGSSLDERDEFLSGLGLDVYLYINTMATALVLCQRVGTESRTLTSFASALFRRRQARYACMRFDTTSTQERVPE